jgi:hypothetical protein
VVVRTGDLTRSGCALRYAGAVRVCGVELPAKVEAIYERRTKTVRCVSHDVRPAVEPPVVEVVDPAAVEVVESGTAGASARGHKPVLSSLTILPGQRLPAQLSIPPLDGAYRLDDRRGQFRILDMSMQQHLGSPVAEL